MDLHESGRGQMRIINDVITPVLYEILKNIKIMKCKYKDNTKIII